MCFSLARHSCVLCRVKWTSGLRAVHSPIAIILSHRRITSRGSFLSSFDLTHVSCLISLRREICVDPLSLVCTCPLYIHFPASHLAKSSLYFSDGMCSCCCLLFPIAVFASQRGDFGIAAELRCHGSGLCCRTVYTWDLESLSVVSLSPIYSTFSSQVFFGVAEAISTPLPLSFSQSPQPITLKSTLTYVMRHIYMKTKFMSIPVPVPLSLPSSFHLLISLSL